MDAIHCKDGEYFPGLSLLIIILETKYYAGIHPIILLTFFWFIQYENTQGLIFGLNIFFIIHFGLHLLFLFTNGMNSKT